MCHNSHIVCRMCFRSCARRLTSSLSSSCARSVRCQCDHDLMISHHVSNQEELHRALLEELDRRRRDRASELARSARGEWGMTTAASDYTQRARAKFQQHTSELHTKIKVIRQSLEVRLSLCLFLSFQRFSCCISLVMGLMQRNG